MKNQRRILAVCKKETIGDKITKAGEKILLVTQSKWQKKREECKAVMLNLEWKKKLKEKGIEVSELLSMQKKSEESKEDKRKLDS